MGNRIFLTAATVICALAAAPALADTIDFTQWGGAGATLGNGGTGHTSGGAGIEISGPASNGFTVFIQTTGGWQGQFADAASLLYDNDIPGPVTITFATGADLTPIQSISDITAQADDFGPYTTTFEAFSCNGETLVADCAGKGQLIGVGHFSSDNLGNADTIPGFSFTSTSADIAYIVLSTTDDADGIGVGPTATTNVVVTGVPEPATWTLLMGGFGALGAALRFGRRRTADAMA
jgi:hypothetical protein